ncbi:MAG: DUF2490 domain-containing protein [Bacteroidota bacterium]
MPIIFHGQENLTAYWQPQMALNYRVSNNYSHNFSLAYRSYVIEDGDFRFKGRQIDLVHFSKFNLQDNQSVSLGVQYRFRNIFDGKQDELRITQQYNITSTPLVVRFGHRFRTEQRILKNLTIHRFRYRFALDFPLKGEKLDIGEPFLIASMEQLLSVSKGSSPQYDVRLTGQMGWKMDRRLKLLAGIEYRMEDYTFVTPQSILFLLTSAQLSF